MPDDMEQLVFAALGDATRRKILQMLADGNPRRVSEIASDFQISRQAVTKHLNILAEAGITETHWSGRERLTRTHSEALTPLRAWVTKYDAFWTDKLNVLKRNAEQEAKS